MNTSCCRTILNLLVILLVFLCPRGYAKNKGQFSTCPPPAEGSWWEPLEDPCALFQGIQQSKDVNLGCCLKSTGMKIQADDSNEPQGNPQCGPCNLQTYNIASACGACQFFKTSTTVTQIEAGLTAFVNSNGPNLTLSKWIAGGPDAPLSNSSLVPQWASTPVDSNDMFDVTRVVLAASDPSTLNSSSISAPSDIQSPSPSASAFVAAPSDIQSPSALSSASSSPSPNRSNIPSSSESTPASITPSGNLGTSGNHSAAIVGGVLGSIILLALIGLGFFCITRRRRRMHSAPSAEFMPVVAPRPGMMIPHDESPPPFSPGAWRDPVLEKVNSAASSQRALDAGTYSGSPA